MTCKSSSKKYPLNSFIAQAQGKPQAVKCTLPYQFVRKAHIKPADFLRIRLTNNYNLIIEKI
jgi:hypothetical protein